MEHIEYEERVLITESDYQKVIADIVKEGRPLRRFHIDNIYLDNEEKFIRTNKMMLRIRLINDDFEELTLKIRNADNSNREINETMESHPLIDKELDNKFDEYFKVAELVTERIEVDYDEYLFVIDKNIYHGKIDYDLEIEAKSQQIAIILIKVYCDKYNLQYDPNYKNKCQRAFEQADKENGEN